MSRVSGAFVDLFRKHFDERNELKYLQYELLKLQPETLWRRCVTDCFSPLQLQPEVLVEKTVVCWGGFGFDCGPVLGPPASKFQDVALSLTFLDNLMDGWRAERKCPDVPMYNPFCYAVAFLWRFKMRTLVHFLVLTGVKYLLWNGENRVRRPT